MRLDLVNGAKVAVSATAMLAWKMLAAKGTDNRQIADGNIAPLLLPLSEDALNPFQCAADRGARQPEETSNNKLGKHGPTKHLIGMPTSNGIPAAASFLVGIAPSKS
jgi:hypothetical protein